MGLITKTFGKDRSDEERPPSGVTSRFDPETGTDAEDDTGRGK